ncbi:MAG TPA: DNA cytosine methyltransferase [Acidisarcina sp.]
MASKKPVERGYYEFFAGGGMARAGLGPAWRCLLANDVDPKKASAYANNWGDENLEVCDVAALAASDLPPGVDLVWASFPCQDLSLAGSGAGLFGSRSGTFWPFWNLIQALEAEKRSPNLIVLENVCGALTSHDGQDFRTLIGALRTEGYYYGALVVDAVHFVPQSRPRLFIIASKDGMPLPGALAGPSPDKTWTTSSLLRAHESLDPNHKANWIWWQLPKPDVRKGVFADVLEDEPTGVRWHTKSETNRLLDLMSPVNRDKVSLAMESGRRVVGTIYKRTRKNISGARFQRAEVRFDDIAGCLRTPTGGSSRQLIMVVEGQRVRSRLLSPREAGRLMGLPEGYDLPCNYNEAYHLAGDGLVVPVVRHLAQHILEPLLDIKANGTLAA